MPDLQTVNSREPEIGREREGGVRDLLNYILRFESAGAVKSQRVRSAYEVVYGGIARHDRPLKAVTLMTVSEVLAWQDRIDSRYPSEAAGAYQVMEDTLRGLVNAGQIDPNALFNKATQDGVAVVLMQRRGLSKFVAGEISAEGFADSLAREWASLPVVSDQRGANRHVRRGQSYYAGDNLNEALADPGEFLRTVSNVRSAYLKSAYDEEFGLARFSVQAAKKNEVAAVATKPGIVSLGVEMPVDGSIMIRSQIGIENYLDWNISTSAEYEFATDAYKIKGTAIYENDDLSLSLSTAYNAESNIELIANFSYSF